MLPILCPTSKAIAVNQVKSGTRTCTRRTHTQTSTRPLYGLFPRSPLLRGRIFTAKVTDVTAREGNGENTWQLLNRSGANLFTSRLPVYVLAGTDADTFGTERNQRKTNCVDSRGPTPWSNSRKPEINLSIQDASLNVGLTSVACCKCCTR